MRILLEYNKSRSHNTIHATGKARATASSEAVVLTVAVVGPPIRGAVESASTVVLAEKTIPIPLPLIPTPPTRAPTPPMAGGAGNPAPPTIAQQGFEVLAEQQKPLEASLHSGSLAQISGSRDNIAVARRDRHRQSL